MAVDFSEVRVGDLVKLTRGEDEFVQVRVEWVDKAYRFCSVRDSHNTDYYKDEWDTLEIVKPPLPTKLGSIIRGTRTLTTFVRTPRGWVNVQSRDSRTEVSDNRYIQKYPDEYEVLFVPED